jgi:uncharacterized membrane protein
MPLMNTNPSTSPCKTLSFNVPLEATLFRIGLVSAGGLLLHLVFVIATSAPLSRAPGDVLVLIGTGIMGLFLLVAAGLRRPPGFLRWLILLACLADLVVRAVIWVRASYTASDTALYTELAGELLRHGINPYAWDFAGVFDLYRVSRLFITPKLNGAGVGNYPYPALPFLLAVPFQALDLPGVFLASIVAHAVVLILLFLASPRSVQPLILLPIFVGFDLVYPTLGGSMDIMWVAFLVGMVVAWRRPTLRAVLFGLAAAVKQSPWLVTPFLVIRIWRDQDGNNPIHSVGRFLLIAAAAFLVVNAPFVVWEPEAWLHGVTGPLRDDLIFFSHGGLSGLSQFGFVYLPKHFYLIAMLSVLGLLLFAYWRHYNVLRNAFWAMPGIFMWVSYRSLISYWTYWVFPMLATLIARTSSVSESEHEHAPDWRPTLAAASAVLGVLLIAGIVLSSSSASVGVRPQFPLFTAQGRVTRMDVEVTNQSRRTLTPRFAIQHRYAGGNPLPWHIDLGPRSVPPGQTAHYRISTDQHAPGFFAHDAAQLVVTDAGGDYALRGTATIGPDRSFLWPDAIANPAYLFWNGVPIYWELVVDPPGSGKVSPGNKDGRGAATLALNADGRGLNRVVLQSLVPFPLQPFGIWVYSDPPKEDPSSVAYGLEIDDGDRRVWFLFGSTDYAGPLEEGQCVINRIVPPRTWVYQEIDVPAAYAEAGWSLPDLKPAVYRGLDVDLRLVHLGLLLAADGAQGDLQAYFGPIEQKDYQIEPQMLMAETFDDPAGYYIRVAESYIRGRNYSLALEAYQRALEFSPGAPRAVDGFDQVLQHLAGDSSK